MRRPADAATAPRRVDGLAARVAAFAHAAAWCVAVALPAAAQAQQLAAVPRAAAPRYDVAAARSPEPFAPVVVELRIGHVASRTVRAYRAGTAALVPAGEILTLAEIPTALSPAGVLTATLHATNERIVIDATRGTAVRGALHLALAEGERLLDGGELYVASSRLAELLGVAIEVRWSELLVVVPEPDSLPVGRRLAQETARALFRQRRAAAAVPAERLPLARPAADGLVVDYTLSTANGGRLGDRTDYVATLGGDVLGGALDVARASTGGVSTGRARTEASWTGVWRENAWLRQLRVGDGTGTGPRLRPIRGLALTNAPYQRSTTFGVATFNAELAPGWLVEAYRNGQLVDFDTASADGGYTARLPVQYGENPVEFVAYGPRGERREFNRSYRVLDEGLPKGRTEYGLSAGRCSTPACARSANFDLRHGVTPQLTVRGGAERFWGSDSALATLLLPYAGAQASLTNGVGAGVDYVHDAFVRAGLSFERSTALRVQAQHTRFSGDTLPSFVAPVGRRAQSIVSVLARPFASRPSFYVQANADRVTHAGGSTSRARLESSGRVGILRLVPYVRAERTVGAAGLPAGVGGVAPTPDGRWFAGATALLLPRGAGRWLLGSGQLRLASEVAEGVGMSTASVTASRRLALGFRADAGVAWVRGAGGAHGTFTVSRDLSGVRSYSTVAGQRGAPVMATQLLQGSVIADRGVRRPLFAPGPSIRRAGLSGRVFLDLDADGRFGAGDSALAGVAVRVGSVTAASDESGWYRVWNVDPFEPVLVTVDSATLASPLWVPLADAVSIEPSPNRFRTLDVPVVPGGSVEGRVMRVGADGGRVPLPGVPAALRDRRTGAVRAVATFADAEFLAYGVRPGEYDLVADSAALARLGATAAPVRVTIPASPEGARVAGVTVAVLLPNDTRLVLNPAAETPGGDTDGPPAAPAPTSQRPAPRRRAP